MHIGISRPPAPHYPIPDVDGAVVAQIAEEIGFESVFYGEHPVSPVEAGGHSVHAAGVPFFQDTLVMMARATAVTKKINVGSAILVFPLHHPVLFAKQLSSIDFYSGGRVIVGAGIGWSRIECEAMGGNFKRRWSQTRETITIMRSLWSQDITEFHGEFFDIEPIRMFPKPASKPWPPILLPGPPYTEFSGQGSMESEKSLEHFGRIVEFGDGWLPGIVGEESMKIGARMIADGRKVLDRLCREAGRDPKELHVTALLRTEIQDGDLTWPKLVSRDVIRSYEDAGVERVVVTAPTIADEQHAREVVTRLAEAIL